jgi:hypothetical protein
MMSDTDGALSKQTLVAVGTTVSRQTTTSSAASEGYTRHASAATSTAVNVSRHTTLTSEGISRHSTGNEGNLSLHSSRSDVGFVTAVSNIVDETGAMSEVDEGDAVVDGAEGNADQQQDDDDDDEFFDCVDDLSLLQHVPDETKAVQAAPHPSTAATRSPQPTPKMRQTDIRSLLFTEAFEVWIDTITGLTSVFGHLRM